MLFCKRSRPTHGAQGDPRISAFYFQSVAGLKMQLSLKVFENRDEASFYRERRGFHGEILTSLKLCAVHP